MQLIALLLALVVSSICDASPSLTATQVHLFDVTYGFTSQNEAGQFAAPSGSELYVTDDDGSTATVSITTLPKTAPLATDVGLSLVQVGHRYQIPDRILTGGRYTTQSIVTGILTVPFKFHLSDRAVTAGSTLGGYIGYQTSLFNSMTVTPILAGGLALVSTAAPGGSGGTSAGVSIATGFIGSVGPRGTGVQLGIIVGLDYLGRAAGYQYEGKPWLAFEVGYNFGQ